jgi:O-acetyl-ADP-ribose deacetylase (regulator of RNase III)
LKLAVAHEIKSIAFPAISTGAYGFLAHRALATAVVTVAKFLAEDWHIAEVVLLFRRGDY